MAVITRSETDGPLQLQVSSLDYSSYVGLLGIGRVSRGVVKRNMPVTLVQRDGTERNANLMELYGFDGLERKPVTEAGAGDIVVFSGIDDLKISDTVCARGQGAGLPPLGDRHRDGARVRQRFDFDLENAVARHQAPFGYRSVGAVDDFDLDHDQPHARVSARPAASLPG